MTDESRPLKPWGAMMAEFQAEVLAGREPVSTSTREAETGLSAHDRCARCSARWMDTSVYALAFGAQAWCIPQTDEDVPHLFEQPVPSEARPQPPARGERDYLRSVVEQIHRDAHDALSAVAARSESPRTPESPASETAERCVTCGQVEFVPGVVPQTRTNMHTPGGPLSHRFISNGDSAWRTSIGRGAYDASGHPLLDGGEQQPQPTSIQEGERGAPSSIGSKEGEGTSAEWGKVNPGLDPGARP